MNRKVLLGSEVRFNLFTLQIITKHRKDLSIIWKNWGFLILDKGIFPHFLSRSPMKN